MEITNIQKDLMGVSFANRQSAGINVGLYERGLSPELLQSQERRGFILLCHGGTATYDYFHTEHTLHSRDIIILFPGDIYSLSNPSADFACSWVSYSAQAMDEAIYNFPSSFFSHIADHPVYTLTDNDEYSNRLEYMKMLKEKMNDHDNICRYEIMLALLRSLFMEILNRIVRNFRINTSEPKHRRRLLDEFVDSVVATPRCREVAYFAQRLCITPKYLSAIVSDGTGLTAKEFIDRNAISAIKQLLRTTDLSVKQIAENLGYSGSGNLCRFFKSHTGTTISTFKNDLKG
ncbi:MAG: AraC family transcriptional regulator [Alistipes sp.]|nr:AraC family transcriptional regulator [Alistipes sp.]